MECLGIRANGFSKLDIFVCKMDKEGHYIVCGDHGEGKTDAIQAFMLPLSSEEYKTVDNPITKGKKRMEINVDLKVEPGDEITIMDHIFRANVGDNITVALVKTLASGPKLTLFNTTTGDQYNGTTTETRKIVDRFLGRFPDPHKLDKLGSSKKRSEREEFIKIVAEMSRTKEGGEIDFSPFIERLEELRESHSSQKAHKKLLSDDLATMPVPQPDWATKSIEQEEVSEEIQRYNDHETENQTRSIAVKDAEQKLVFQERDILTRTGQKEELINEISQDNSKLLTAKAINQKLEKAITDYEIANPIVEHDKIEDLNLQLEELQLKIKNANLIKDQNEKIKLHVSTGKNKLVTGNQLDEQSEKAISEKELKLKQIVQGIAWINERVIPPVKEEIERVTAENQPIPWKGQTDPKELLEPLPYLNDLMSKAKNSNKQVEDRTKYESQEEKIKSTTKEMEETTVAINQVKEDERMVIESSVFPHPGIQIRRGEDNKVDVWVKDKHGVWNTYNDTNHAERIFQAVNIVTHGAGGDLKLLFVNEGYALLPYKRKQIIEAANRKGFKVMMEAFTAEDDENAIYLGEPESTKNIVLERVDPNINEIDAIGEARTEVTKSMNTPAFGPTGQI